MGPEEAPGRRRSKIGRRLQEGLTLANLPGHPFRRVVSLPEDAEPAQVDASCRDGILRVTVKKRESSQPRRIEIN